MNSSIVAAGVAFGITLAGLGVASAQSDGGDNTSTTAAGSTETTAAPEASTGAETTPRTEAPAAPTPPTTAAPDSSSPGRSGRPGRAAETELTGETAEKVRAAALAAVPGGTVIRVETDADGSPYEAHVRKADGTEVVVKVNEAFEVTAVEEGHTGRHGPGRPGGTPLAADVAAKVEAAALAAVPNGTIIRVQGDADGGYHAHVRNAEGTELVVRMDANFQVTATEESTGRPGGPGGRHHRGPAPAGGDAETETD